MKPSSITLGSLITIALFCVPNVRGWGANGHHAVGYIGMRFLAPKALSFVQSSLGPMYLSSLGPAATWADEIKSNPAYAWASELHFVDAEGFSTNYNSNTHLQLLELDNPPLSCSVSQSRDCTSGRCILTAIANYTTRVVDTRLSPDQRQEALKFLDHFIGDIGQPLHVEALALGGNQISVICDGSKTNLHALWDSDMLDKLLIANYNNSVTTWATSLSNRIKAGVYASLASPWISCSSTTSPVKWGIDDDIYGSLHPPITPLHCPLVWAKDANEFDCSFVFNFDAGSDLCTSNYYIDAIPIIEMQIAKQGYRLAAWLNVLFDGHVHLP